MLIRLRLDPRLLEEAVHLELRRRLDAGDAGPSEAYHRQADSFYALAGGHRESAFVSLHRRLFGELGFEAGITGALARQRETLAGLESLACLRALAHEDEGADLGAQAGPRAAVLRVRAARFLAPGELARFLDHELTHVADLLSSVFAHDPGSLAGIAPHRRRLVQERYRALWAASVDGRLERRGLGPVAGRDEHRRALRRGFPFLPASELDAVLDRLWRDPAPTHARLVALATGRAPREPHQPGAPCPLCAFPTHRWADATELALIVAIRTDVPGWEPEDGLCDRCLEMYEIRSLTQA
jgi:hypothetical protein